MTRPLTTSILLVAMARLTATAQDTSEQPTPAAAPPAKAASPDFPRGPRVGGHFGLALPIVTFSNDGTAAIGRDFAAVGVTPGVTLKLTERWAIDFEFVAVGRWEFGKGGAADRSRTVFVVDPGVVYNFGPVAAGLRLAVGIGDPMNYGLIPILVVPFKVSRVLSYFLELDLPVFVTAIAGTPATAASPATDSRAIGSFGLQLQTGFSF
jgi:hypothetical protein